MIIKTGDLDLRSTGTEDPELKELINDVSQLFVMSEIRLYPDGMPESIPWRIEKDGRLIGEVRLTKLRWYNRKAELSVILLEEFRGKGFGKMALEAIVKYAFGKMNLHRLEAEVIETNKASLELLTELGFKEEGRKKEAKYASGKYYDIIILGLLAREYLK